MPSFHFSKLHDMCAGILLSYIAIKATAVNLINWLIDVFASTGRTSYGSRLESGRSLLTSQLNKLLRLLKET